MPLQSTRGAGSAKAFGFTARSLAPVGVDYLIVAGGGAGGPGGGSGGGGGGGGGYRTSFPGGTKITLVGGGSYPITVGGGGTDGPISTRTGINSVFSTITSAGGGGGGSFSAGGNGGSGGGGGGGYGPCQTPDAAGIGNSPPVNPSQGNPGGTSNPVPPGGQLGNNARNGGGGGGASAPGQNAFVGVIPGPCAAQCGGGNGSATSISGTPVTYAGGGGGVKGNFGPGQPQGGTGGGGLGSYGQPANVPGPSGNSTGGAANTGGGGGSYMQDAPGYNPGSVLTGGSGIVVIRAPGAAGPSITVSPGTNTKTTSPGPDGSATILTFTVSGTLTYS